MGTDVHPAIEVCCRAEYPTWWRLAAVPPWDRNYEFFGLLAGVRGEEDSAWIEPRGLPPSPDHDTWHEHVEIRQPGGRSLVHDWHGVVNGDHTASWFTLAEARGFVLPDDVSDDTRRQWARWLRYMEFVRADYDVPETQVRVVFNFDS